MSFVLPPPYQPRLKDCSLSRSYQNFTNDLFANILSYSRIQIHNLSH
jgi:hypothetical protein